MVGLQVSFGTMCHLPLLLHAGGSSCLVPGWYARIVRTHKHQSSYSYYRLTFSIYQVRTYVLVLYFLVYTYSYVVFPSFVFLPTSGLRWHVLASMLPRYLVRIYLASTPPQKKSTCYLLASLYSADFLDTITALERFVHFFSGGLGLNFLMVFRLRLGLLCRFCRVTNDLHSVSHADFHTRCSCNMPVILAYAPVFVIRVLTSSCSTSAFSPFFSLVTYITFSVRNFLFPVLPLNSGGD